MLRQLNEDELSSLSARFPETLSTDTFSYENLIRALPLQKGVDRQPIISESEVISSDGKYVAHRLRGAFIMAAHSEMTESEPSIEKLRKKPTKEGKIFKDHGLKFHISLPEDETIYRLGWGIICNILRANDVSSFKIVADYEKMSDEVGQEGKIITIYADANPEKIFNTMGENIAVNH